MARNINIAQSAIDKAQDAFRKAKPKPKELTVKDAIRQLYDDVADAIMNKNYEAREAYAKVADILGISDETVKAYYNDIRKEKQQEQKVHSLAHHREKSGGAKATVAPARRKKSK